MKRTATRPATGVEAICRAMFAVCTLAASIALAQEPTPPGAPTSPAQVIPPPAFKAGVDVVVLDVSVLDGSGRPVRDLKAQDFDVRVDGKPRKTLSADVIEFTAAGETAEPPARHEDYSTNEGRPPGRAVVLVMDLASFRAGEERFAVVSASAFLDTLSPSDMVAVTQLPWLSSSLAFSVDRERLKKALAASIGMKQETLGTTRLGVAETVRAERGDTYAWRQIVLRECRVQAIQPVPAAPSSACSAPGYEPECPCLVQDRLKSEVQAYANLIRIDADRQLRGLLDLLSALRSFTGPKLVVVVSQGIVLDEMSFSRGALAAMAGLANARVHVLRPEMSITDASSSQGIQQRTEDIRFVQDGLDTLAGLLGGRVYPAIGDPKRQFERIWQENAASWRLGVDPERSDLDGKPHRLEVKVRRPGLSVLARSSFLPDASARDAATPAGRLRDALFSPVQATALPVRATHYVTPPASGVEFQVRIVGEVDGVPAKADPPSVAFVVADDTGKQMAAGAGRVADEPDGVHPAVFSTLVKLPAGRYMVKLAASAADGRAGSVERHFELTPPPAGALALGDLLLAEYTATEAAIAPGVRPTVTNGQLVVYADVVSAAGDAPKPLELQVAQDAGQPPLVRVPVAVKAAAPGGQRAVSAVVSVLRLGDGDYAARLVAPSIVPPLEGTWRTFRVVTDAAAVLGNLTMVAPFDRRSVLEGGLMARVLAELSDRPAAADPAIAAALKDAEAGRFTQGDVTLASEEDPATPAMIRGLGLLASGQLDAAAAEFKAAVREAPDLSLALAYVGSCFAAGGLDREAAGAWQTTLIEEKRIPVLYALLADAWLRLNDPARALEVISRATTRWPDDADLKRRRAVALARSGKRQEALAEIDALLAATADDAPSACVGFRIAVDRSGSGKVDEQKKRAYATACAQGSAPESPLAAGWLKTPERKRR